MRTRARIYPIQIISEGIPLKRPGKISDEDWALIEKNEKLRQVEMKARMFATDIPFSRIPRGTIPLWWLQLDGTLTYELKVGLKLLKQDQKYLPL